MPAFLGETDLRRSIAQFGLDALADRIVATARPTILFARRQHLDEHLPVGISKIGGLPDLPPDVEWPCRPALEDAEAWEASIHELRNMQREVAADLARLGHAWAQPPQGGEQAQRERADALLIAAYHRAFPLAFRAQIDLSALSGESGFDADLPDHGYLSVFEDMTGDGSGEVVRVIWHDTTAHGLSRRNVPDEIVALSDARDPGTPWDGLRMADVLEPHSVLGIPHHWMASGAASRDDLFDLLRGHGHGYRPDPQPHNGEQCGNFGDQLGGWPDPIQSDPELTFLNREDSVLEPGDDRIRQIFCWGGELLAGTRLPNMEPAGDGYTHVLIEREAMLARRFEHAKGVYQSD